METSRERSSLPERIAHPMTWKSAGSHLQRRLDDAVPHEARDLGAGEARLLQDADGIFAEPWCMVAQLEGLGELHRAAHHAVRALGGMFMEGDHADGREVLVVQHFVQA